ncbi:SNO glutamine amidotransferase [Gonapodya prolifera JEL478]|uniref:glutaminase n=1 Tax=Gonapodya prolifera (strain JEL478) TaxID=1344416 RepID=A0A139AVB3_GONPJ|nr:SNO glutamine amidotransferase [Gonapodya prolifera JEL478]|eukprot:KXS20658.1 SNO glutamine amidotransferase [Gonapodya prolifera JEL478]
MSSPLAVTIGVLGLQGGHAEHAHSLLNVARSHALPPDVQLSVRDVRKPEHIADPSLDALIIPGGESTSMAIIAESMGLMQPLRDFVNLHKKPAWGTCAGLIMLANHATHTKQHGQSTIGGLSVTVDRNAFGSQRDSFVCDLAPPPFSAPSSSASSASPSATVPASAPPTTTPTPFPGIFIRAPLVSSIDAPSVLTLCTVSHKGHQGPVAVRQDHILGTAFHPELTQDTRWHEYFVNMVVEAKRAAAAGQGGSGSGRAKAGAALEERVG